MTSFVKRFALVLALLVFGGVAASAQVKIFVLGSSTAEGIGPSNSDSTWVNRFRVHAQTLNPANTVTNLAKGGYTTYHIRPNGSPSVPGRPSPDVTRNITYAKLFNPDAIIINMPSNDATLGYTVAEQLVSYDRILAAAGTTPVWITTTQPRNLDAAGRANLMAMRDSTLDRYGDRALDFWTPVANADGTVNATYGSGDGIHLNNAGHRLLFQAVEQAQIVQAVTAGQTSATAQALRLGVFPNPFHSRSSVVFELDSPGPVSLRAFDVLGREVAVLADGESGIGPREVRFDASALAPGTYVLRLTSAAASLSLPVVMY